MKRGGNDQTETESEKAQGTRNPLDGILRFPPVRREKDRSTPKGVLRVFAAVRPDLMRQMREPDVCQAAVIDRIAEDLRGRESCIPPLYTELCQKMGVPSLDNK